MDLITGPLSSQGFLVILMVEDELSKYSHFGDLGSEFAATSIVALFVEIVIKYHSFLKSIISNGDLIFLSQFWEDLFHFSGTSLRMSSTYNPQIDGQTECIEQYL